MNVVKDTGIPSFSGFAVGKSRDSWPPTPPFSGPSESGCNLWKDNGQINFIDTKAKCRHQKEFTKGTLRQVFICLRPKPPPPCTL
jgi:hypothetical protein